jgi:membrane protein implicated in regulation of membrane protease activity
MTEKRQLPHVRLREWLRSRGVWFWAIKGTACSLFLLWAGSQFTHDRGQSVEWYTGFGQWLGGLGSLIVATVALWIATRDRKEREQEQKSADNAQATLVLVELEQPEGQGLIFQSS